MNSLRHGYVRQSSPVIPDAGKEKPITNMKKITAIFAALGALVLGAVPAQAGNESELVAHSHQIELIVDSLSKEFRTHYRHSGGYCHLRQDLKSIKGKASHIHGLAHSCQASLSHIQSDLRQLDAKAHHLHEVVDAIECGRYRGHVDGDTRHVHELLNALNQSIHAMKRTVRKIAHHSHRSNRNCEYEAHYGHRDSHRAPHPAEIIGSIFRTIHRR